MYLIGYLTDIKDPVSHSKNSFWQFYGSIDCKSL